MSGLVRVWPYPSLTSEKFLEAIDIFKKNLGELLNKNGGLFVNTYFHKVLKPKTLLFKDKYTDLRYAA